MPQSALIILHPNFEEIEAITPADILSRADVSVTLVSTTEELLVTGRSGIAIQANLTLSQLNDNSFDLIMLPGGPGIEKIRNHQRICRLLSEQHATGRLIGCICAAPLLLLDAGLLNQIRVAAHPSTLASFERTTKLPVIEEQNIITSAGAGTATEFALELVKQLKGPQKAEYIATSICWREPTS